MVSATSLSLETRGWGSERLQRKRMEKELQKMQKLESIGVLAGGIAHDFNNFLTAIVGNISLGKMYEQSGQKASAILTEAEKACRQARQLTQQLLTFSKGGGPIKKFLCLAAFLKDTATFALSGSNVRCRLCLPEDLWWAEIDEGQMGQVINNLMINANQAMPEGGLILLSAENAIVSEKDALPLPKGKYIKISIKDQGIGIQEGLLPKIFDPFFTTKQKGRGLGLAIVYSVVKIHEGHIIVESQIGEGTIFTIFLPAAEREVFAVKAIEKERFHYGRGKILFMDDQPCLRDIV